MLLAPATRAHAWVPAPGSPYATGLGPNGVVAADFNRDGRADLGVIGDESDDLIVLLGQGGGAFAPLTGSPFALGDGPSFAAVADFNGDGRPDLAAANFRSSVSVMIQQ